MTLALNRTYMFITTLPVNAMYSVTALPVNGTYNVMTLPVNVMQDFATLPIHVATNFFTNYIKLSNIEIGAILVYRQLHNPPYKMAVLL